MLLKSPSRLSIQLGLSGILRPKGHGHKVTGYTLRRWFASVSQGLQLPIERCHDLGNMTDSIAEPLGSTWVPEPMGVRYNKVHLEANTHVERVLCRRGGPPRQVGTNGIRVVRWGKHMGDAKPDEQVPYVCGSSSGDNS